MSDLIRKDSREGNFCQILKTFDSKKNSFFGLPGRYFDVITSF